MGLKVFRFPRKYEILRYAQDDKTLELFVAEFVDQ